MIRPELGRLLAASLAAFLTALPAPDARAEASPRLVLLISVDQLRRDRLDPKLPGGLGRLAREGRVYIDAAIDHANSVTCSGDAAMATGHHPGPAGVPGNQYVDRESGRTFYCVEDDDARVLGGSVGRSPRRLRVDALGDWMKAARAASRVFSVAGKDRIAIVFGGRRPDGVYWLSRREVFGFTTSRYYRDALPAWVERFNGSSPPQDGFLSRAPDTWTYLDPGALEELRPDDYPGESTTYGRTSPHPIRDDDLETFAEQFARTPFFDQATLEFALELVRQEGLGKDDAPDLLAIGLAATDLLGHLYGPRSREARDALLRLDADLAAFFDAVEEEVGAGRTLVALSADHGVLPLPEWLEETGQSECPVAGGRVDLRLLWAKLAWNLHREVGGLFSMPRQWVTFAGTQLTVSREAARERGVSIDEVAAATERYLESHDAIAEVWTLAELRESDSEIARLYLNSYDPERSGDLAVQIAPGCLVSPFDMGTSHGSPYAYDREVPIVFFGPGVPPGHVAGRALTVDIAPTLAALLGIEAPSDLDGRPLLGADGPGFDARP